MRTHLKFKPKKFFSKALSKQEGPKICWDALFWILFLSFNQLPAAKKGFKKNHPYKRSAILILSGLYCIGFYQSEKNNLSNDLITDGALIIWGNPIISFFPSHLLKKTRNLKFLWQKPHTKDDGKEDMLLDELTFKPQSVFLSWNLIPCVTMH